MGYWAGGYVQDLLIVIVLLAVAAGLRRTISPMQRLGMPDALIAGALGMGLGPAGLDLLPFSPEHLQLVVYHALALVFIAFSLQAPPSGERSGTARSIAFAIPIIACIQGIIGLLCVLGWNATHPTGAEPALHTGFAMMLPLGFSQGPGPAMTLGQTWDDNAGFSDGAQVGLIMAALGYAWCCFIGVGLVAWGRRRGWDKSLGRAEIQGGSGSSDLSAQSPVRPGARVAGVGELEPMTAQIVAIAMVYLATWLFLINVGPLLPEEHQPTLYGFHFLLATGFGLALRPLAARAPGGTPLDNDLLARIGSLIVDVATCAALAAVRVDVLVEFLGPVLLISSLGGLSTVFTCIWIARRAYPTKPFQHAIVTFGSLSGTATTGLALLRMLDPKLEGPSGRNYVLAVTPSAILGLPLFVLMPLPILGFPGNYPGKAFMLLGILVAYIVALTIAWRLFAPLRLVGSPLVLWPEPEGAAGPEGAAARGSAGDKGGPAS